MEFPAYVPAAVRDEIDSVLNGNYPDSRGWVGLLSNAEENLAKIETAIAARTRRGEIEYLDSLRKQKADAVAYRDMLADDVGCLRRLALDERMQDAYARLTNEFTQDEQWRAFIDAAWQAKTDYSKFRDRLRQVKTLTAKIADASENLAGLLRQAADTGFSFWPSEFYNIPELLRQTDNPKRPMWDFMQHYILGDTPRRNEQEPQGEIGSTSTPRITVKILEPGEVPEIDPDIQARNRAGPS